MVKVFERMCLVLWGITTATILSCLGLGVMIVSINLAVHSLGQPGQLQIESVQMILAGLVTLPLAFYARHLGVKHLHFLEHDDTFKDAKDYKDDDDGL